MTIDKAVAILHPESATTYSMDEYIEAKQMARIALLRQRRMKPMNLGVYLCPCCKFPVYENQSFCANCGQAIDWHEIAEGFEMMKQ